MSSRLSKFALLLTVGVTTGAVYIVHSDQTKDRARMHRQVQREIEEERRKRECAESGGPCQAKPLNKPAETDEERRRRECAEAGGICELKPPTKTVAHSG